MAGEEKQADALTLRSDGTVLVKWDDFQVELRRPKAKEWGSYIEELEAADEWLTQPEIDAKDREPRPMRLLVAEPTPYKALYTRILDELGGQPIAQTDLPGWMIDAKFAIRLNAHWMALPLTG